LRAIVLYSKENTGVSRSFSPLSSYSYLRRASIDARRAAGGRVAGSERDDREQRSNGDERDRIVRRQVEQL
jgi:hypothetical protein